MLEQIKDDEVLDLLLSETPERADHLKVRVDKESGDFIYILSLGYNDMVTLNRIGKGVFELCDGKTTIRAMVDKLHQENPEGSYTEMLESVVFFVRDMQKKGVLYKGSPHILEVLGLPPC